MNNSIVKHALAWLEQCEEYFLGRGRQNASRAVQDAIDMQSPDEVAKFDTLRCATGTDGCR